MHRHFWLIIASGLLVAGTILCALRWKAWFVTPEEIKWEGDTINVHFKTFGQEKVQQSLQKKSLEWLLLGDIHSSLQKSDFDLLAQRHSDIDFWVQLGDWMERPYFYYEQQLYHSIKKTSFESLPIITIPGNHEYKKGIVKQLSANWISIFPNPNNGPKRFLGRTYMVDFPTLRVIAIDTDGLRCMSDYTQVCFWLKSALSNSKDKLTVVVMHHPIFSTAKGRQNPLLWLAFYGALREADVVFSGHDHNYARRTIEYKERFWTNQQPTLFIGTNASQKNYANKSRNYYDCTHSGTAVYEYMKVVNDTLYIRTYELKSGKLVDEICITND